MSEDKSIPGKDSGDATPATKPAPYAHSPYRPTPTIVNRVLPSDTPPVFPAPEPGRPVSFAGIPRKKSSLRSRVEIAAGIAVLLGLSFLFLPRSRVNHGVVTAEAPASQQIQEDSTPVPDEEIAPAPPVETPVAPAPVAPRTPAEWVKQVSIGGVRARRILIAGKVYPADAVIPPFNLRWIAREGRTLIFKGPDDIVYTREFGR